jgi:hypothetical protein
VRAEDAIQSTLISENYMRLSEAERAFIPDRAGPHAMQLLHDNPQQKIMT